MFCYSSHIALVFMVVNYGVRFWGAGFLHGVEKERRKIWKLLYKTHCHLLPLLYHCLPVFD